MLIDIGIPEEKMIERYEAIYTAAVNDMLHGKHGLHNQTLPTDLHPLVDGMKAAGFAFTIKGMPTHLPAPDDEHDRRGAMIGAMTKGSFVVWDTSRDEGTAHYGEMMTAATMMQGCTAAVVDGGIRDVDRILETGFKVWSRYRTPASMSNRFQITGWQTPIKIGHTIVNPGDLVFADMDGIVVVPRDIALEVLEQAEEQNRVERGWRDIIASGLSPQEVVKRGGMF